VVLRVPLPVEALRHEVGAAILLKQPAGEHGDAGHVRHPGIGILDSAILLPASQIAVGPHAVELEEPVLEAVCDVELARSDLAGLRVPGHDGLGSGPTG